MLGGHLDSWHSATGATDNAIGCAVMMEAARILQALGVKPRRTIRVALWGGEEQGLLGSKAYVKRALRHGREAEAGVRQVQRLLQRRLGHRPHPRRPSSDRPRRRRILREVFAPFEDLGMFGATATTSRAPAAPTARRSTRPACRASAWGRTRSSTTPTPGTPTSTPTSAIVEEDVKKFGDRDRLGRVSPGDARRDAAALHRHDNAGAGAGNASIDTGADCAGPDRTRPDRTRRRPRPDESVSSRRRASRCAPCLRETPRAGRLSSAALHGRRSRPPMLAVSPASPR